MSKTKRMQWGDTNQVVTGDSYNQMPRTSGSPSAPGTGSGGIAMAGQNGWEMKQRTSQQKALSPTASVAKTNSQQQSKKAVANPYSLTNPMGTLETAATELAEHEANKPQQYQSQYGTQIQSLIDKLLNRESFSYDYSADPLYQQYAQQYQRGGQLAMQDAMAQTAALTGGYGNTYAQTAGQQTYQRYMENLSGMIPQLQQAAYQMYQDEGNNLRNNLGMLQAADETGYGRYRDDVGDYWAMLDYLSGKYNDWYPRAAEQLALQQAAAQQAAAASSSGGGNDNGGDAGDPLWAILAGIGMTGSSLGGTAPQGNDKPNKRKTGLGANTNNFGTRFGTR